MGLGRGRGERSGGGRDTGVDCAISKRASRARSRSPRAKREHGSPPASRTRSRSAGSARALLSTARKASLFDREHQHKAVLLLERAEKECDLLRHENAMLKLKVRTLKQRLFAAQTIFDMDQHDTATRPLMRMRKRDMARPYVEKGLMSGTIYMFGEAIACGLFFHKKSGRGLYPSAFLHYSVLHSTLIGMLANGPLLHLFFEVIERLINFQSQFLNVVCKIIVDQVVWGCLWNSCYIFLMNLATDSPGFGYIGEGLGTDAPYALAKGFTSAFSKGFLDYRVHAELLKQGIKMLPWDILCYWVIPLPLRALWVAVGDVVWVTILSQYD